MLDYQSFLASKRTVALSSGIDVPLDAIHPQLFDFQKVLVQWALRKGRAALFCECGMGKTFMQLEYGRIVHQHSSGDILILAPLGVIAQTISEGAKLGIQVHICRNQSDVRYGVNITNYEMLQHFDPSHFVGVILDESSILKSYMGKTKRALVDAFASTPYRLACTATPSPNDVMELGNHSEFLGVMPSSEMLMRWFINDTMSNGKYRLKGHAQKDFWEWVASWAVSLRKPSDLGFSDQGFALPELRMIHKYITTDITQDVPDGQLFRLPTMSATNLHKEMRLTAADRAQAVAKIILKDWLLSCGKKSTLITEELRKSRTLSIKLNGTDKVTEKTLKSDWHISENIKQKIGIESLNCENLMQKNETQDEENDTSKMRNTEVKSVQNPVNLAQTIPVKRKMKNSELHLESESRNMSNFSLNKMENAQFAETLKPIEINGESSDLQLTMTTQAGKLENCSVQAATWELENFTMIPSDFVKLLTILKDSLESLDCWTVWCNTDYEQDELESIFGDAAISIRGSQSPSKKVQLHDSWIRGERKILICKPKMFGYGLNWQHCHNVAFVGLSYSFEDVYQAIRRSYRFGQTMPVKVYIVAADTEGPLVASLERKMQAHMELANAMNVNSLSLQEDLQLVAYNPQVPMIIPEWLHTQKGYVA